MRRPANELDGIYSVEEAMEILEKVLLVYRKFGNEKERFGDMIDRIGFENVEKLVLGDGILTEKQGLPV